MAGLITIFHTVGRCKLAGADDSIAVVDSRLMVREVEGLRVADASVMPTITSGNTNAPTMMIAEKAAGRLRRIEVENRRWRRLKKRFYQGFTMVDGLKSLCTNGFRQRL